MRAEISKCSSAHVLQNVSFLYIKVFWLTQLIKLNKFQYYFDYNHTFDLFYNIEIYSYKVLYFYFNKLSAIIWSKSTFQCTSQSSVYQVLSIESFLYDLYNIIYHVMKSKILSLLLLYNMLKLCYNFWNLLSTWLFLLTNTMNATDNNSSSVSATNLNACVNSTDNNSHDYLSFNMSLMLSYMNSQLIYYFIFSTISAAEQAQFQQLMKQHKTSLELLEWDSIFNKNNESDIF